MLKFGPFAKDFQIVFEVGSNSNFNRFYGKSEFTVIPEYGRLNII